MLSEQMGGSTRMRNLFVDKSFLRHQHIPLLSEMYPKFHTQLEPF